MLPPCQRKKYLRIVGLNMNTSDTIRWNMVLRVGLFGSILTGVSTLLVNIPLIGLLFCCLNIVNYGIIGVAYGYFARQDGAPRNIGFFMIGGGIAAIIASFAASFVSLVINIVLFESGFYDVEFQDQFNNSFGGFNTTTFEFSLPLLIMASLMIGVCWALYGFITGAIGGALYAATMPTPQYYYQQVDTDWGI